MNTILLKKLVPLFCLILLSGMAYSGNETVTVKTFLITLSDNDRNLELDVIWEENFILKFQWEPEGLYVITKFEVTKNQLDDVFQKQNVTYSIDEPKVRELPKKMFNRLY